MVQFMHQDQLNEAEIESRPDFSVPIAPGDYTAQIIESDYVENKGGGHRYAITFEIIAGQHSTRRIWHNLNSDPGPKHSVEKANKMKQIAGGQMQKMCFAAKIEGALTDTEQLHNIPMIITVAVKPGGDFEGRAMPDRNVITSFKAVKSGPAAASKKSGPSNNRSSAPAVATEQASQGVADAKEVAASNGSKKPWER